MQRGERDLARADQVERVVGQAVDLLLGVGQEAGPVQRLLAHQHGRHDRLEAVAPPSFSSTQRTSAELEHHELALQVGEARAGDARARLHVDQWAGELEVVLRPARPRLAHLAQHRVLAAARRVGEVGQRAPAPPPARPRRWPAPRSAPSRVRATSPIAAIASAASSPTLGGRRSPSGRVLLRAHALDLGQQLAPAPSSSSTRSIRASVPPRRSASAARDRLGLAGESALRSSTRYSACVVGGRAAGARGSDVAAGVGGDEPGDASASRPTAMFCGMSRRRRSRRSRIA